MDDLLDSSGTCEALSPLEHERTFQVSLTTRLFGWAAILVCGGMFIAALGVPLYAPGDFTLLYVGFATAWVASSFMVAVAFATLRPTGRFVVDEYRIVWTKPDGEAISLHWDEITRVHRRNWNPQLELSGEDNSRRIVIPSRIGDFEDLASIVLLKTSSTVSDPAITAPYWLLGVVGVLVPIASDLIFGGVLLGAWAIGAYLLVVSLLASRRAAQSQALASGR